MGTYYPSHNYGPEHAAALAGNATHAATPKRQPSEKQLAANRLNARRSTGPRSEAGKARSSRNAFRHGLTGQVSIQTDEDRAAHQLFTESLIADLKPEGALERQIAFAIAEHHWRLNRIRAMEDNIFSLGSFGPAGELDLDPAASSPELHSALTSAQVFLDRSKDFERLTLYEQRIHRTLEKDMAQLRQLQTTRRAEREAALEEAAKLAQVAEHRGEEAAAEPTPSPAPEAASNGFVFLPEEIAARIHRNERLKQFTFHEKHHWNPEIEYPLAA